MWRLITDYDGRRLLLTQLLAMEYAGSLGATVDWTGPGVSVQTGTFYKPSDVLGTRTPFRYGIARVQQRATDAPHRTAPRMTAHLTPDRSEKT